MAISLHVEELSELSFFVCPCMQVALPQSVEVQVVALTDRLDVVIVVLVGDLGWSETLTRAETSQVEALCLHHPIDNDDGQAQQVYRGWIDLLKEVVWLVIWLRIYVNAIERNHLVVEDLLVRVCPESARIVQEGSKPQVSQQGL